MIKINDKNKTCLKNISIFVLKTLFYFAILLVLVLEQQNLYIRISNLKGINK